MTRNSVDGRRLKNGLLVVILRSLPQADDEESRRERKEYFLYHLPLPALRFTTYPHPIYIPSLLDKFLSKYYNVKVITFIRSGI